MAASCRIDDEAVLNRVGELCGTIPSAARKILEEIDDWDGSVTEVSKRLIPNLDKHVRGLTSQLHG
jgi:hypothetical protein